MTAAQPKHPGRRTLWIVAGVVVSCACACAVLTIPNLHLSIPNADYHVRVDGDSVECERSAGDYAVHITGDVLNDGKGSPPVIEVVLIATLDGDEVARDSTWVTDSGVQPGETTAFDGYVAVDGARWNGCRARIGTVR